MREIGGYIEFEHYCGSMLHEDAIALNCGRNCLAYLFKSRGIKKLKIPYFICNSIFNVCEREGIDIGFYHVNRSFRPENNLNLQNDEWLYLINYYGQLSNDDIYEYVNRYHRVIVDQANSYFQKPLEDVDTIYTCRKYFGVADGGFLYTNKVLDEEFPLDESFERMHFLLGRYERTANEFYNEYTANNEHFKNEPIKRMSKLTRNLLHGIDYDTVRKKREENFRYLDNRLRGINTIKPAVGTFMYPFMIKNGKDIRKKLQSKKIYIPTLWPKVFELSEPGDIEYTMVENILPLPIDQRYGSEDMEYLVNHIHFCMEN